MSSGRGYLVPCGSGDTATGGQVGAPVDTGGPALSKIFHLRAQVVLHRFVSFGVSGPKVYFAVESLPELVGRLGHLHDLRPINPGLLLRGLNDLNLDRPASLRFAGVERPFIYRTVLGLDDEQLLALQARHLRPVQRGGAEDITHADRSE